MSERASEAASPRTRPFSGADADLLELPILVVDDEQDNLDAFRFSFRKSFKILAAQSGAEGLRILSQEPVAVVVTDQRMPEMSGLEFLEKARAIAPEAVPILVTAYTDVELVVEAINRGYVYRYIKKPWDAKELRGVLMQALERYQLRAENARLSAQLREYAGYLGKEWHGRYNFGQLIGNSAALKAALSRAEQVARTSATVLLRGESGTGKELVAHAIHINSPRESRPFVRVNCAALASSVLESELFGHERGAFTGAHARHPGRFELSDGGTLFLDEIGDLPMEVQVKLLRVFSERSFERVGGTETIHVDVRIVSATHKNLEALVEQGRFREDLYYRLNVFPIQLPPLRERLEDVPLLIAHFLEKWHHYSVHRVTSLEPEAQRLLLRYHYPGNVRELENLIERALILARGTTIQVADLEFGRDLGERPLLPAPATTPMGSDGSGATEATPASSNGGSLAERLLEQERAEIAAAIERAEGRIATAARLLGINRSTLYYRMRKHELLHLLPNTNRPDGGEAAEQPPPSA